MTKSILSALGALFFLGCMITLLTSFAVSGEDLYAILAVLSFGMFVVMIVYAIEDTKIADKLSNLFAGEEVNNE